jgi:STAS domain
MPAGLVIELHLILLLAKMPAREERRACRRKTGSFVSDNLDSIGKAQINIVASNDSTLAYLSGRIDIDSSPAIRDRLLALLQSPCPELVCVDLSAVTHFDSSGVATGGCKAWKFLPKPLSQRSPSPLSHARKISKPTLLAQTGTQ